MSDEDMKAELERLRSENAAQERGRHRHHHEGQREGCSLNLRNGSFPGDLVQGTVAEALGYVRRHPEIHCGKRWEVEDEGVSALAAVAVLQESGRASGSRNNHIS